MYNFLKGSRNNRIDLHIRFKGKCYKNLLQLLQYLHKHRRVKASTQSANEIHPVLTQFPTLTGYTLYAKRKQDSVLSKGDYFSFPSNLLPAVP